MSIFNHSNILNRFASLPPDTQLFFLPCRDRIVHCTVRMHLIVAGSLHPAAATLLDALHRSEDGLSLSQLTEASGASGFYGTRFTGELLARLCQANEVERPNPSVAHFTLSPTSRWQGILKVDVIERELCYLPRSRQLARHIPKHEAASRTDVLWWNPSDEEALYGDEPALRNAIANECHTLLASERDVSAWMERDVRSEELERCKLLLRTPELIKVEIIELSIAQQEMVVHRCYFHKPSPATLRAKVYRFEDFVRHEGYSAYFERADLGDLEFSKSIDEAAILLPR